jgi:hypothetical protein
MCLFIPEHDFVVEWKTWEKAIGDLRKIFVVVSCLCECDGHDDA